MDEIYENPQPSHKPTISCKLQTDTHTDKQRDRQTDSHCHLGSAVQTDEGSPGTSR